MKTRTAVAASVAALALPTGALANDEHAGASGDGKCDKSEKSRQDNRAHESKRKGDRGGDKSHRGHGKSRRGHRTHFGGFVVKGSTAATALPVADGKLTGPLTLDPKQASFRARKILDLSREDVEGDETATFGTAGDEVKVVYKGLSSSDALKPTDRIKVFGGGKDALNIRLIVVKRHS